MAFHDMECTACGQVALGVPLRMENGRCPTCKGGRLIILWTGYPKQDAAVHKSERTTLYYSYKERKWQYPATNNQPIPDRLVKRGYERVEFPSLRSLEQHGKQTGAISERAWFDKGSGRGLDE